MTDDKDKKYLPAVAQQRPFQVTTLTDAERMGEIFVKAGLFQPSVKEGEKGITAEMKMAQATVKVIAGASMGISPFAAMRGLHIVKDKVEPGYQTLLALVKKHGYKYKIHKREVEIASVEFFDRDGSSMGVSTHTKEDQAREGLGGDTWRKYPRQMHLARAVRAGVDAWLSDVLDSPVNTGSDQDYDEVIEAEGFAVEESTPTPKQSAPASTSASSTQKANAPCTSSDPKGSTKTATTATAKPASAPTAATAPSAIVPPVTAGKTGNAEGKDTAETGSAPATAEAADDIQDADEIQQASDGEQPGEAQLNEILQTGLSNGWSEEQVENWLMPFLESKEVDLSDPTDSIFLTWNFEIVAEAITYLATNQPEA